MRNHPIITVFLALAACSSSSGPSEEATSDAGHPHESGSAPAEAATDASGQGGHANTPAGVLIIGTLADADLAEAQSKQDVLAKGGEAAAKGLGDVGHTVMLGTSLLGTTPDQFLALDRWKDDANIDGFYSNKTLEAGFAEVFKPAPSVTVYLEATSWAGYGTPESADGADPYYWVVVRGTMKYADLKQDQAIHDAVVKQVAPKAQAAGDVAHVVYTGRDDVKLYFSIDAWPAATDLAAFYGNPEFAKALSNLFDGPPTVGIYQSTHWYQW
jgi:hypothetical protein